MKWILFLVALLVIGAPGFAQRTNSQGKKLVKKISVQTPGSHKPFVYIFDYDNLGQLVSAQDGDNFTKFYSQENRLLVMVHSHTNQATHTHIVETNENGYITLIKDISKLLDGSGIGWELYEFDYDYDYEMGNYTLKSCSLSTWFQFNGHNPILSHNEYDRHCYIYSNGEIQTYSYADTGTSKNIYLDVQNKYYYTNNSNDTNINLMFLIDNFTCGVQGDLFKVPLLTEWCPSTAFKFPKEYVAENRKTGKKQIIYTYEYVYENGTLTTILQHRMWDDEIINTTTINIEYYY